MNALDDNTVKIVAIIAPVLSTVVLGILAYFTAVANLNAVSAARKADENAVRARVATQQVQQTLSVATASTDQKLTDIATITDKTHILVNSNYGASLMATLLALRQVARLTQDPVDKKAADAAVLEAERLYADHQAKQGIVDIKGGAA